MWSDDEFSQWVRSGCADEMSPLDVAFVELYNPSAEMVEHTSKLVNLISLSITGGSVPSSFPAGLKHLNILNMDLEYFPPAIFDLEHLCRLQIFDCLLTCIPTEIGRLRNLRTLDLRDNRITTISGALWTLDELIYLFLDQNSGISIPSRIGNMRSLICLTIQGVSFHDIHPAICSINLETFRVDDTFNLLPEVLEFYTRLNSNHENPIPQRLVFHQEIITPTPPQKFVFENFPEDIQISNECSVCVDSVNLLICGCRHVICTGCINRLLEETCPVCRKCIDKDLIKRV